MVGRVWGRLWGRSLFHRARRISTGLQGPAEEIKVVLEEPLGSNWFLFVGRGAARKGDFGVAGRLDELRAVAELYGVTSLPIVKEQEELDSLYWAQFEDEETAAAVARRCVLVRAVYRVWAAAHGTASFPTLWSSVASAAKQAPAWRDRLIDSFGEGTWKMEYVGVSGSPAHRVRRSQAEKLQFMALFDFVTDPIKGAVDLASPLNTLTLLEAGQQKEAGNEKNEDDAPTRRVFLASLIARGGAGHLTKFPWRLTDRPYIGRTTLPPQLASLMANSARLKKQEGGCSVLDPYCGTASTLLACAYYNEGLTTVGVDVDARVLLGGDSGIQRNFAAAGLEAPELIVADATTLDFGDRKFDAIVTDLPYGINEGTALRTTSAAARRRRRLNKEGTDDENTAYHLPIEERLQSLFTLAANVLKPNGHLVFLMALHAKDPTILPVAHPRLTTISLSREPISSTTHRLMVTMRRLPY